MASSTFSQFLSFFSPTKPLPSKSPPPTQTLPLSSPTTTQFPTVSLSTSKPTTAADNDHHSERHLGGGDITAMAAGGSLMCPSLAYANTLYFQSAYNVEVVVEEDEPEDRLLSRFRREVMRAGVIQEVKRRRYFENKQDEKKRKSREAAKRNSRRRRPQFRDGPSQFSENLPGTKKDDGDDEDNWELPEGDDVSF